MPTYLESLLALSPWIAFALAAVWCWVLELRDDAKSARRRKARANARQGRALTS